MVEVVLGLDIMDGDGLVIVHFQHIAQPHLIIIMCLLVEISGLLHMAHLLLLLLVILLLLVLEQVVKDMEKVL